MITKELVDFIKKMRVEKHSDAEIQSMLVANGWLSVDVMEAFQGIDMAAKSVATRETPPPTPVAPAQPAVLNSEMPASINKLYANPVSPIGVNPLNVNPPINNYEPRYVGIPKEKSGNHKGLITSFVLIFLLLALGISGYYLRDNLKSLPVVSYFFPRVIDEVVVLPPAENPVIPVETVKQNTEIVTNRVGIFNTIDSIPTDDFLASTGYSMKEELGTGKISGAEGDPKGSAFIISRDNTELLRLLPITYPDGSNKISEIIVTSPNFRTVEGASAGMTISDLIKIYPDFRVWYTYVGNMFVLESPQHKGVQFLLDKTGFINSKKKLGSREIDMLTLTDFDSNTKITSVRVFYVQ